ncbi:Arm DNA-binding domain-containing protein [Rhodococcus sp. RCBS9]|uniref:Arm DNA-binding domain-containing protein n=1 Tax=Rhodococcus sp. RCBS9 TaxID=3031999 RepID=UPI0024026B3A|nr:Arm DNA-binding domain-containing protein [Rhodococcus sp. RCBS9]WEX03948.1 Arm DNA-binding domain-containing protein [Rhodococcus sp. RCBS9]
MARQQLPPQIKKIELAKKERGKNAIRYQLTVDTGVDPITGRRKQLRKRFATEADASDELARIQNEVQRGTFVHSMDLTVEQACTNWLLSLHGIKPSTKVGYEDVLKPVRSELGDISVQKLTRLDIDKLIKELREREGSPDRQDTPERNGAHELATSWLAPCLKFLSSS